MFQSTTRPKSSLGSALNIAELVYHNSVRAVRKAHGNAFMAIFMNMLQSIIFVLAFYFMFQIMGMRSAALRGDFMIYIMTGVFLYMTHTKTMGAVAGSEGPASPMMQHAPMNTAIAIAAAMVSTLYIQVLSLFAILFVYDVAFNPFVMQEIYDPIGCLAMLLLSWFSGAAIGMVVLAVKPWFPTPVSILSTVYQRANMIASGKMFVANTLPGYMLVMFDWNPLFHTIDQSRGYAFVNYVPRNSSWEYAFYLSIVLVMIGLMGEFYTRKHASVSWGARR
ncbi:MAG: ABC transporter permease [Sagittula sp.]|jgi:ABC-type polysaccharide/polyol phosphate export permease|uniref:ABC transporter permease n=1 Tax=unclassified Sagittula TaxID=2624628 RepID=UPI000C2CFF77|nr:MULTISPECIES: ABC transporter permease [unclassified Sagittula]AUC53740.1 ABC transporter permease [Sagittula sp. P11]WHZ35367.1 ABC transporter permease [Sagittula sp. MA-2]